MHSSIILSIVKGPTCAVSGADGARTKTPQNVVVLRGEDAVLHCSTDTSSNRRNPINWKHDGDLIVTTPCTSHAMSKYIASPPDSLTDCNIRVLASNTTGISGAYSCGAAGSRTRAVAMVIVLGELHHSVSLI